MTDFKYTPDQQIEIHRVGAIRQMCRAFLSHENGLPEWVKNSTAAYLRENRPRENRVIILAFSDKRRLSPASIACLDFVGMTSEQIERDFRIWADPDSATRSADAEVRIGELGGHGNGGKCYMTQMFEHHAVLRTARNGKGCNYGVKGGEVEFGYAPNAELGRDFAVDDVFKKIDDCLRTVNARVLVLPEALAEIARAAVGFTFVSGVKPKGYAGRIPTDTLVESLLVHHQMITPLQQCSVYVIGNGQPYNNGQPLGLPRIDPMPGFETARVISIPETLQDPSSHRDVQTVDETYPATGEIKIFTSEKNMRFGRSERRRWRHTVNFHTSKSGIIGKTVMLALDADSNFKDYMYCDCYLDSLDPYQTNERGELSESPLTRAVIAWIAGQVREYCREFEARERRKIRHRDRDQLSRMNEWLDHWKNQFMRDFMKGLYGEGRGTGGIERRPLPSGKPVRIEIATTFSRAGIGVYLRPRIKFYDSQDRRIRPSVYRWISEDNNVALVDEELGQVQTFSCGTTTIYAETPDGKLRSNSISLEVLRIQEINIVPPEITLAAGSRCQLKAVCRLSKEEEASDISLTWIADDSSVAVVTSSGIVYGANPGRTRVTALDESCKSDTPADVIVERGEGTGKGKRRGRGNPLVLISEIDVAPNEDQTVVFRADEPPIMQRPTDVDNNVWWINLASPFARLYYTEGEYGVDSEAWRMYHVERMIDIIVQIALTLGPDSEEMFVSGDWIYRAGELEGEIRKKAIESLNHFIRSGELRY